MTTDHDELLALLDDRLGCADVYALRAVVESCNADEQLLISKALILAVIKKELG